MVSGRVELKSPPEPQNEVRVLRLLLVEDNELDAELVLATLERSGYEVHGHRVDTLEGLRLALHSGSWDAVISDHSLPGFSGQEALDLVRQSSDLPFLILSGTIGETTAVEYMRAGAHDYLMKGNLTRLVPALERELHEAQNRRMRREAERKHRESQARYQRIVEAAAEGIWIIDRRARAMFANQRLAEILGCTVEEILGRSIFRFVSPPYRDRAREMFRRPGPEPEHFDLQLMRTDGAVVWALVSTSGLVDEDDNWTATVGMVTDITERKRLEQQLLASEQEKQWFCREVLLAVTQGKLHLCDAREIPLEGEVLVRLPLAAPENYSRLREEMRRVASELGMDSERSEELLLAVGEAVTNAIKHGQNGQCELRRVDGRLVARVFDEGPGIRPEDLPASLLRQGFSTKVSLGMGYSLMLELCDAIWLASDPGGTVVQLEKSLLALQEDDLQLAALLERFS